MPVLIAGIPAKRVPEVVGPLPSVMGPEGPSEGRARRVDYIRKMRLLQRRLCAVLAAFLLLPPGSARAAAFVSASYRAGSVPRIATGIAPLKVAGFNPGFRLSAPSAAVNLQATLPSAVAADAVVLSGPLAFVPASSPVGFAANAARLSANRVLSSLPFDAVLPRVDLSGFHLAKDKTPAGAARLSAPSSDFARIFEMARRILTRPAARKFLREIFKDELVITDEMREKFELPDDMEKIKEVSQSQLMLILQHNAGRFEVIEKYLGEMEKADEKGNEKALSEKSAEWRAFFRDLIKDEKLSSAFKKLNDPLSPMRLELEGGGAGYRNVQLYANHESLAEGRKTPPADLKKVVLDFIAAAETELMLNVFDFDLMEIADALVAKAEAGVKVTVGIDWKNSALKRPEVQAVVQRLTGLSDEKFKKALAEGGLIESRKNLSVRLVDSVGLNHQKMIAVDWNDEQKAKALFSSGNLTQSCIGKEGDLKDVENRPDYSIPNANHIVTMDSWLAAQTAADNMTKTLVYGLKGNEYPLGGAFKIFGEKPTGAAEAPYIVLTFSPKGGLGDINRDLTRRLILETRGPLRVMQFAASAQSFLEALYERAKREMAEGLAFDLKGLFDAPFALRPWSVPLALSGYEFHEDKEPKEYVPAKVNRLREILGAAFDAVLKNIRIPPSQYRTHQYAMPDGAARQVNAKLHHKVLISGGYAILGTSFNFSENANHNQEQFLLTNEPVLVAAMTAAFDGLFALSPTSLVDKALSRNEWFKTGAAGDDHYAVGDQYEHVDEESGRTKTKK